MEAIRSAAQVSIGRGCGFAGLGVLCLMLGLSFDPVLATRAGGVSCLIVTLILALFALQARTRPYQRTEAWLILPQDERPPATVAQRVIGEALRETYFWFAKQSVTVSILLLGVSFGLSLAGFEGTWA